MVFIVVAETDAGPTVISLSMTNAFIGRLGIMENEPFPERDTGYRSYVSSAYPRAAVAYLLAQTAVVAGITINLS